MTKALNRYKVVDVREINAGLVEITYDVFSDEMQLARLTAQIAVNAVPINQLAGVITAELQRRYHDYITAPDRINIIKNLEWYENPVKPIGNKALADLES